MFTSLPKSVTDIRDWTWEQYQPFVDDLLNRELTEASLDAWMHDWAKLSNLVSENMARARLANDQDTSDEHAEAYLKHLFATIFPPMSQASNELAKKLVDSGLQPENFTLPLRKMQADIDIFRIENVPLQVREQALGMEYGKVVSNQSAQWEGEEVTLLELQKVLQSEDRDLRERSWRLWAYRWLEDRDAINNIWTQVFDVRQEMAKNAGFANYRDYRWKQFKRFDYTPDDCQTFHDAIEQVVVPAAQRANARRMAKLGIDTLRPWDLEVDISGLPALRPWKDITDFEAKAESVFSAVDPDLGHYFQTMRQENLLDLPNRKNKGPGAYCTRFGAVARPFIFMNAVNRRDDVRTLLHEAGHAFHGFETMKHLAYPQQQAYPIEFAEVASMAMELLASPYLTHEYGGYYSEEEAARDRIDHLERIIFFWPYMAVVDGFQQWAYTSGDDAKDPAACDEKWQELWQRFIKVDYSGLDATQMTGWHRKQHIYRYPFYYVEYGLAQLGAVQVWARALNDQALAVKDYRSALALGGTRNLHELYGAAGVKFAFDADTLGTAVELIESTISDLEVS
jgi:oligoendopeptidase F